MPSLDRLVAIAKTMQGADTGALGTLDPALRQMLGGDRADLAIEIVIAARPSSKCGKTTREFSSSLSLVLSTASNPDLKADSHAG